MSLYDWNELVRRWEVEAITVEQAIGQLITWASSADELLKRMSGEIERLQRQNLTLAGRVTTLEQDEADDDEDEEVSG